MKLQIECVPCQIRQSITIAKKLTGDEKLVLRALKEALSIASTFEALFDDKKNIFFLLKIKCETFLKFFNGRYGLGEVVVEHAKM
ncbi:MAG: hypothetical protein ACYDIA_15495 [Candidatus Humimicrobiaceae bacterium]